MDLYQRKYIQTVYIFSVFTTSISTFIRQKENTADSVG